MVALNSFNELSTHKAIRKLLDNRLARAEGIFMTKGGSTSLNNNIPGISCPRKTGKYKKNIEFATLVMATRPKRHKTKGI